MSDLFSIRASSLAGLFDCPARWKSSHIDGLRLPRSPAAQLGTAVHASTAVFDSSRMPGADPVSADDAAGALVDAIHNPGEDVNWEDTKPNDAEKTGLLIHARYCSEIAPRQTYRGVEINCERLEIADLGICLTGTTDRVRETPDGIGIADLKTGGRAVSADGTAVTQGHGLQIGVYELLAEHALGIPITAPAQVIGMSTTKTPKIGTGEIVGARAALLGTPEHPGALEFAAQLIHSGNFYGNPKSMLCSKKYCPAHPTCQFKL